MKKLFALLVVCVLLFTACTTDHDQHDIEHFVKTALQIRNFKVSPDVKKYTGEDSYEDEVWTVRVPKTGLEFHVIDDFRWGMESLTNSLRTDYDAAVLDHIKDQLPKFEHLEPVTSHNEAGICSARLMGAYSSKEELYGCWQDLQAMQQAFADLGYNDLFLFYDIQYMDPLRDVIPGRVQDDGDSCYSTQSSHTYEDMLDTFVRTALKYRYDSIDTFTEEEIAHALKDYTRLVGRYDGTQQDTWDYEPDKITYYGDILSCGRYTISFGSLYEVLVREGFEPIGNAWHYTFTSPQNDVYEVSYDFNDHVYEDPYLQTGYYYLKNGEVCLPEYYDANHFTIQEIEEMTGLRLIGDVIQ